MWGERFLLEMEQFPHRLTQLSAAESCLQKTALIDRLQEEWDNIDKDLCVKSVESMSERIRKRLRANEGPFL